MGNFKILTIRGGDNFGLREVVEKFSNLFLKIGESNPMLRPIGDKNANIMWAHQPGLVEANGLLDYSFYPVSLGGSPKGFPYRHHETRF